jgi:hypothetical protein
MSIVPPGVPKQTRDQTDRLLRFDGVTAKVALLGVRGYYLNTMGKRGKNDRGIYDDALFLLSPDAHVSFNANTDPSVYRKHIATLKTGLWKYKVGRHKGYTALTQAAKVTVSRDQEPEQTGYFGINIHKGSMKSTSSLGCQTIHPNQWAAFIALVQSELKKNKQTVIPYLLIG